MVYVVTSIYYNKVKIYNILKNKHKMPTFYKHLSNNFDTVRP